MGYFTGVILELKQALCEEGDLLSSLRFVRFLKSSEALKNFQKAKYFFQLHTKSITLVVPARETCWMQAQIGFKVMSNMYS